VTLTLHPLLVSWSRKSRAILLLPLWAVGLYRASVSVQRCTLPLPIPLFTLWIVQPVQSLSACTTVHFTFTYTSVPPMAVRPVESLSACTTVHFTFTYTSTPPMDRTACTEPQCLYKGALYLYLYLYSSYGPYGLYRTSVPVQRCTLPLPIPLLPLWTVQPVQSLSACTWCTLPLSIPLLPLWAVRPVQSLSACKTVHFTFTYTSTPRMGRTACTEPQCLYMVHFTFIYTSTPPMGRTACTEPQCLYNGALYLFTPYSSLSLVIQQVRSFFQSEFSGECDLVLPL